MIGLLSIGIVAAWLAVSLWLAGQSVQSLRPGAIRIAVGICAATVLSPLPIVDELVGGAQFRRLCNQNALLSVDASKIHGAIVRVSSEPANAPVAGMAVPVRYSRSHYRDASTNEVLATSDRYDAAGGWLVRALSASDIAPPLTFDSTCSGEQRLVAHGVTLVR